MTNKEHGFHSLNIRMLLILVVAIVSGAMVYFVCSEIGDFLVEKYYMSEDSVNARRLAVYGEFRRYILEKSVASTDRDKIGAWTKEKQNVTLIVRSDHSKIESGRNGAVMNQAPVTGEKTFPELTGEGVYYMRFSDGVYQISISENSQQRQYFVATLISLILGFVVVLLIVFAYIHRVTARIMALASTAKDIGRGNLEKEIYVKGNDELSQLGSELNDMRLSIISRMESEGRAWQANSSLITAISHDLRTPMTALIGYLELLKNGEYSDSSQQAHFIDIAHSKAMELKDLTDELFKYFLVFSNHEPKIELETYDAEILLDQITGENVIELREAGYDVRVIKFRGKYNIKVDVLSLKRIFDNLFSNIRKYACKERTVIIRADIEGGKSLSICISNSVSRGEVRAESNKIGLRTCEKIAAQLGGSFRTVSDGGHFMAELTLPVVPGTD